MRCGVNKRKSLVIVFAMIPFGCRTTLALAHITVKNSPTLAYKCFAIISNLLVVNVTIIFNYK
jgi:hypothetical protein